MIDAAKTTNGRLQTILLSRFTLPVGVENSGHLRKHDELVLCLA